MVHGQRFTRYALKASALFQSRQLKNVHGCNVLCCSSFYFCSSIVWFQRLTAVPGTRWNLLFWSMHLKNVPKKYNVQCIVCIFVCVFFPIWNRTNTHSLYFSFHSKNTNILEQNECRQSEYYFYSIFENKNISILTWTNKPYLSIEIMPVNTKLKMHTFLTNKKLYYLGVSNGFPRAATPRS